jgi:hypothetical protein
MPADPRLKAQVDLILNSFADAAAFPANWEEVGDVHYLYRQNAILVRQQDETRVTEAVAQILHEAGGFPEGPIPFGSPHAVGSVLRITVPSPPAEAQAPLPIPEMLNRLDPVVGRGKATPDHVVYASPYPCPADEPAEVPPGTVDPFPPPGFDARCCRPGHCIPRPRCDGDGVFISVLDTGLLRDAAIGHPWLVGVQGAQENPYGDDGNILPYACHGTFVAGCLRCAAPKASVFVERAYDIAAARFESDLGSNLEDALDRNPDILVFPFITSSRHDQPLLTFDDFYERRIRYVEGLVVVSPAGNDGKRRWMWPAAYPWVVSVGALSASWRDRATFSNYGGWVDVFAPGEDLVNAYATGTYVCNEPPVGERREFHGMAKWSGTSFSTPIVAGLIAARMSATGENGQQAADSLLRLARSQAIPGVGAVLYPGQACCETDHWHHPASTAQTRPPCGCDGHTPPRG